jgi:alpha-tubulin suppressor-like RCC1 family protein
LYAFGSNEYGQLGLNSKDEYYSEPTEITFFKNKEIKNIFCEGDHTMVQLSKII